MNFQLVIQFYAYAGEISLSRLIRVENAASEALGLSAEVDGHDIGSGEGNVFIRTIDPMTTLARLLPLLEGDVEFADARVGCRCEGEEKYVVLYPQDSNQPFEVV